jgi:hypothetical protein
MKVRSILFLLLTVLLFSPVFASAEITIQNVILNDQMIIFNYSDWETQPGLLNLVLYNDSDEQTIFMLKTSIKNEDTGNIIYESESYQYVMGPQEQRTLTNTELISYTKTFTFDQPTQNDILELGYIIAGNYCFMFEIDGEVHSDPAWCFTITNPPAPELITPGGPDYGDPQVIYSDLPFFRWTSISENPNIYYEFTLCEVMEGETPEVAIQNEPILFASSASDGENSDLFLPPNASSLQYNGVEELEEGNLYCWQVIANVPSSSGYEELESEIWTFEVGTVLSGDPTMDELISILRQLGVSESTLSQIADGEIQQVILDGETITIEQMFGELTGNINLITYGITQ